MINTSDIKQNKPRLSLGINILSYSVEILLMNLSDKSIPVYLHQMLPETYDPLPFTAELIKKNIPGNLLNKISYCGIAFPGEIEKNNQYISNSLTFPEYYERSFCKELLLILNLKNIRSYTYTHIDCENIYTNHFLEKLDSFMIIFQKQGISASVSEIKNWHNTLDWGNLGHFIINSKKACTCGNFGCLQTESGDIASAVKFKNKIAFKNQDLFDFSQAIENKNLIAQKVLKESVLKILDTVNLHKNFPTLPESLIFSSNVISQNSSEIIRNIVKETYKSKINFILLPANSTVTGAALPPSY